VPHEVAQMLVLADLLGARPTPKNLERPGLWRTLRGHWGWSIRFETGPANVWSHKKTATTQPQNSKAPVWTVP